MENVNKKRGRPPKIFTAETDGMTYEGVINYALDRQIKSELEKSLAKKSADTLTDEERKYLETQRTNRTKTLNIRFTESEYQDIISKCKQYGYKKKSEYVRDCVRANVRVVRPIFRRLIFLKRIGRSVLSAGTSIR